MKKLRNMGLGIEKDKQMILNCMPHKHGLRWGGVGRSLPISLNNEIRWRETLKKANSRVNTEKCNFGRFFKSFRSAEFFKGERV